MPDKTIQNGGVLAEAVQDGQHTRRTFVRRAALIGLPVVLATIPSRTVWAKANRGTNTTTTTQPNPSLGGSVSPSGSTSAVQSLL